MVQELTQEDKFKCVIIASLTEQLYNPFQLCYCALCKLRKQNWIQLLMTYVLLFHVLSFCITNM